MNKQKEVDDRITDVLELTKWGSVSEALAEAWKRGFAYANTKNIEKGCFNTQCLDYKENKCYGDEPENCDHRITNSSNTEKVDK